MRPISALSLILVLALVLPVASPADDFLWRTHTLTSALMDPTDPRVADLDGDADLDIVVGHNHWRNEFDALFWFENVDGLGTTWTERLATSDLTDPYWLEVGDLDGDGDVDLIGASKYRTELSWFENDGQVPPSFAERPIDQDAAVYYVADLNGDGALDLVVSFGDGERFAWYENSGSQPATFVKHFIEMPHIAPSSLEYLAAASSADIDGDGDEDLAVLFQYCRSYGCYNIGAFGVWYENDGADSPSFVRPRVYFYRDEDSNPGVSAIADLDGDGDPDIVTGTSGGTAFAWHENLGGYPVSFQTHVLLRGKPWYGVYDIFVEDLDADEDLDLVISGSTGDATQWYENLGGTPAEFAGRPLAPGIPLGEGQAGDIDNDGDMDLVSTRLSITPERNGILDWFESPYVQSLTPTPPPSDLDDDGLPDNEEGWPPTETETHRLLPDSDGDGLGDATEVAGVTNPRARDTDGDGLMDGIEADITRTNPVDPLDPASYTDVDGDGLPGPYDPNDVNPDTDGDRFSDGYEAAVLGVAACADGDVVPQLADVNLDAAVSNADALAVLHLFIRKIGPEDGVFQGTGFRYADPSRDGHISNMDALLIQSFFLGNVPVLPWP